MTKNREKEQKQKLIQRKKLLLKSTGPKDRRGAALTDDDIETVPIEVRTSRSLLLRSPFGGGATGITLADADPTDAVVIMDNDFTQDGMGRRYDMDPTDSGRMIDWDTRDAG
jgi:hypothetical protein